MDSVGPIVTLLIDDMEYCVCVCVCVCVRVCECRQTRRRSWELTNRELGNLTVLYSVSKCLPSSDVSCITGIQVQYSTFDVQISSDFQFSVNGSSPQFNSVLH